VDTRCKQAQTNRQTTDSPIEIKSHVQAPKAIVATSGGDLPKVKRVPPASDSGCPILSGVQRKILLSHPDAGAP
jgi:hypothetical protein